ncbi:hypothetical protein BV898_02445 [Hypsibius exemplaris]|uniref:NADH dehydrogenase [ubiquinone] 1 alpha subcomplex subunit 13 n=1 Tax=Hypsibius exemplaris TaxID=2072580 RepID=A0A1W0X858_HYPEX|nr:hypothetical protein BV898_02445 [Hypsibius exemplaris]
MLPLLLRSPRLLLAAAKGLQQSRNVVTNRLIPYKQDLPPVGGYAEFDWNRIPQRPFPSHNKQFLAFILFTFFGLILYERGMFRYKAQQVEILDAKVAMQPLLFAERDRLYLRRIRRNYEAEAELMKDVPDWEVGKWYSEPVYKTVHPNHWLDPPEFEYWAHCDRFEYEKWYHWWYSA